MAKKWQNVSHIEKVKKTTTLYINLCFNPCAIFNNSDANKGDLVGKNVMLPTYKPLITLQSYMNIYTN